MSYQRVIPRDLFNESKLLKSLGQVQLLIHDGQAPKGLRFVHDDSEYPGFEIDQSQDAGDLSVTNLRLYYGENEVGIASRYNSKAPYTLECTDDDADCCDVLGDDGRFTAEFLEYLQSLKRGN